MTIMRTGDFQVHVCSGLFVMDDPRDVFGELKTDLTIKRAAQMASGIVDAGMKHKGGKDD